MQSSGFRRFHLYDYAFIRTFPTITAVVSWVHNIREGTVKEYRVTQYNRPGHRLSNSGAFTAQLVFLFTLESRPYRTQYPCP
jgi:hypothetical protein